MKQILLLFFLAITVSLSGQLDFALDEVNFTEDDVSIFRHSIYTQVVNSGSEDIHFNWELTINSAPTEWAFQICDLNLCYGFGVTMNDSVNILAPSSNSDVRFYLSFIPYNTEGHGNATLTLTSDQDGSILDQIEIDICLGDQANCTVSNDDVESLESPSLYPNPANDFVYVKSSEEVQRVAVYNIIGKKILDLDYNASKSIDVSELHKGLYVVRMIDNNGQVLSVERLNVR